LGLRLSVANLGGQWSSLSGPGFLRRGSAANPPGLARQFQSIGYTTGLSAGDRPVRTTQPLGRRWV